ncbi:MAG: hypothetical protein ABJQ44_18380, partial [Flavobacteriaceae bacterium]
LRNVGGVKHCPFGLPLSQAKYFYNLLYFFHYQNFGLASLIEALNFQFTTKPLCFFSHCWHFVFFQRWQRHTLLQFSVLCWLVRIANVYGFMAWDLIQY